jgi:hypothetical protein
MSMVEGNVFKSAWNKTILAQAMVLSVRNELIKRFMDNRILVPYLIKRCQAVELSDAKVENIQRELAQLLNNGLDQLPHYKDIVDSVKTSCSREPAKASEKRFFHEIERVFRKYVNLNNQHQLWAQQETIAA